MVAGVKDKAGTSTVEQTIVEESAPSASAAQSSSSSGAAAYAPVSEPIAALNQGIKSLRPPGISAPFAIPTPTSALADDLFSAHDFDVDIDLVVPGAGRIEYFISANNGY